jgi:hypothetical protein
LRFVSGGASINFENGIFESINSQSDNISIEEAPVAAVELLNQLMANSTNPLFLVLGIEFYQEVNGVSYSLKNGRYNALSLIRVSGV